MIVYDDPVELAGSRRRVATADADRTRRRRRPRTHRRSRRLRPRCVDGILDAIHAIADLAGVHVAVVSGRSVDDLARFGFGDDVEVIGSHGAERRDRPQAAPRRRGAISAGDARRPDRRRRRTCRCRRVDRAQAGQRRAARPTGRSRPSESPRSPTWRATPATSTARPTKVGSGVLELFARPPTRAWHSSASPESSARSPRCSSVTTSPTRKRSRDCRPGDIAIKVGDAATIAPSPTPRPRRRAQRGSAPSSYPTRP